MRKLSIIVKIFLIIIIIFLIIGVIVFYYRAAKERSIENEPISKHEILYIKGKINQYLQNSNVDYVSTKEIAINIAKAVIGEEEVKEHQPFIAIYDEEYKVWMVKGGVYTSFLGRFFRIEAIQGGSPHVLIQRSNGKILAIWHDK